MCYAAPTSAQESIDSVIARAWPRSPIGLGGLTWTVIAAPTGDPMRPQLLYQHGGGNAGVRTLVAFNPLTRDGFFILANTDSPGPYLNRIMIALLMKAYRPPRMQ